MAIVFVHTIHMFISKLDQNSHFYRTRVRSFLKRSRKQISSSSFLLHKHSVTQHYKLLFHSQRLCSLCRHHQESCKENNLDKPRCPGCHQSAFSLCAPFLCLVKVFLIFFSLRRRGRAKLTTMSQMEKLGRRILTKSKWRMRRKQAMGKMATTLV